MFILLKVKLQQCVESVSQEYYIKDNGNVTQHHYISKKKKLTPFLGSF